MFQSWSWKKRSEDHDSWSKSCCNMREEYLDTWSESCYCNMRREDATLRGWRKKIRRDDDDDDGESKRKEETPSRHHRIDDDDLPLINDDLLEEIMLRLPAKALTRFQIVSKHWRRKIESKYFKDLFMSHQKTTQEPKFLYLQESFLDLTLTTLRLDWSSTSCLDEEGPVYHIEPEIDQLTRVSGSCDGLVCIFNELSLTSPIIVTNPAMVRSLTLPLSLFQRHCLEECNKNVTPHFPGFGKDDVTGTYKLVWLHNNVSNYTLSCEVFDFEVKEWRYLANTPSGVRANEEPVFAKGWLYWIIADRSNKYNILGYDIHTEMFRVFTNTIVSKACDFNTITMCSLSDRIWVTNNMPKGGGMQHFWRIKNAMDSVWESEKLFSIDPNSISPGFKNVSKVEPFITLKATSKDDKKVLVSRLHLSNLVHLLPSPTGHGLVFGSAFSVPTDSIFIPYFQSLQFPL